MLIFITQTYLPPKKRVVAKKATFNSDVQDTYSPTKIKVCNECASSLLFNHLYFFQL
jgi:hypothetical protein